VSSSGAVKKSDNDQNPNPFSHRQGISKALAGGRQGTTSRRDGATDDGFENEAKLQYGQPSKRFTS